MVTNAKDIGKYYHKLCDDIDRMENCIIKCETNATKTCIDTECISMYIKGLRDEKEGLERSFKRFHLGIYSN